MKNKKLKNSFNSLKWACVSLALMVFTACTEGEQTVQYGTKPNKEIQLTQNLSGVRFTAPKHWVEAANTNSLQLTAFYAPEKADKHHENIRTSAEVTLSLFEGGVGTLEENIRRWQGQISLEDEENISLSPFETGMGRMLFIKMVNPENGQAIYATIHENKAKVLTIKMQGPLNTLEENAESFLTFVESFAWESEGK